MSYTDPTPRPRLFDTADPQPIIDPTIAEHASGVFWFGMGALATLVVVVAVVAILARTGRILLVGRSRKPVTR